MRKSLGILIALGLCLSFLPVHAEASAAITSRIVEAVVHADKTITVSETIRLRLPEHEAYELFLDLPDDAEAQAGDVAILSSLGGVSGPTTFEVTATAAPGLPTEDPEELVTLA